MKSIFSMLSSLNIHKLNFCRPASVTNDHVDFESPNITASKVQRHYKVVSKIAYLHFVVIAAVGLNGFI